MEKKDTLVYFGPHSDIIPLLLVLLNHFPKKEEEFEHIFIHCARRDGMTRPSNELYQKFFKDITRVVYVDPCGQEENFILRLVAFIYAVTGIPMSNEGYQDGRFHLFLGCVEFIFVSDGYTPAKTPAMDYLRGKILPSLHSLYVNCSPVKCSEFFEEWVKSAEFVFANSFYFSTLKGCGAAVEGAKYAPFWDAAQLKRRPHVPFVAFRF